MCTDYEGPDEEKKEDMERKLMLKIFGFIPKARVRPTDPAPIVIPLNEALECREMRWGWKVPWDKGPLVNAKSETLTTLPTFKPHLSNRCLIPASSFKEGGAMFHRPGRAVILMAGLWREDEGGPRFVMLTTTPNESVAPYHGRMPFLLNDAQLLEWLRGDYLKVMAAPDKSPLEKFEQQPRLF